jgi:hypothetical protein
MQLGDVWEQCLPLPRLVGAAGESFHIYPTVHIFLHFPVLEQHNRRHNKVVRHFGLLRHKPLGLEEIQQQKRDCQRSSPER